MTTQLETAENNNRAVVISEEVEFIEELMGEEALPPHVIRDLMDRRDVLRDSIKGLNFAAPDDEPVEGVPLPSEGLPDEPSEAYDEGDAVPTFAEDEDHEYQSNRNDEHCLVCGEPKSEHLEDV